MTPIPPVEDRQGRPCHTCNNCFDADLHNTRWIKTPDIPPCIYHFTRDELKELIDQHIAGEQPTGVVLICPICGREQSVDLQTYATYELMKGHPFTCGSESCPSHTVMKVKLDALGKIVMQQPRQEG